MEEGGKQFNFRSEVAVRIRVLQKNLLFQITIQISRICCSFCGAVHYSPLPYEGAHLVFPPCHQGSGRRMIHAPASTMASNNFTAYVLLGIMFTPIHLHPYPKTRKSCFSSLEERGRKRTNGDKAHHRANTISDTGCLSRERDTGEDIHPDCTGFGEGPREDPHPRLILPFPIHLFPFSGQKENPPQPIHIRSPTRVFSPEQLFQWRDRSRPQDIRIP